MKIQTQVTKAILTVGLIAVMAVQANASALNATGAKFDSNVPAEIKKQMIDDLAFMGTIQGNQVTALHQEIFGAMTGEGYVKFFNDRVARIGLNDCGSSIAVACVIPFRGSDKMWITQNYIKFSHPQIARLMVVYHESRHTETQNGNWMHATCPKPFVDERGQPVRSIWTGSDLAGQDGCDVTPYGSYGSSTILLKNVAKFCANCTEKVKQDANLYSTDQLKRIIDAQAHRKMVSDFGQGLSGPAQRRGVQKLIPQGRRF